MTIYLYRYIFKAIHISIYQHAELLEYKDIINKWPPLNVHIFICRIFIYFSHASKFSGHITQSYSACMAYILMKPKSMSTDWRSRLILVSGSTEIGSPCAQGGGQPCICLVLLGLATGGGAVWGHVGVGIGPAWDGRSRDGSCRACWCWTDRPSGTLSRPGATQAPPARDL